MWANFEDCLNKEALICGVSSIKKIYNSRLFQQHHCLSKRLVLKVKTFQTLIAINIECIFGDASENVQNDF